MPFWATQTEVARATTTANPRPYMCLCDPTTPNFIFVFPAMFANICHHASEHLKKIGNVRGSKHKTVFTQPPRTRSQKSYMIKTTKTNIDTAKRK